MKINFIYLLILTFSISFSQNSKKISVHYKTISLYDLNTLDAKTKSDPMKMKYAKKIKKNFEDVEYVLSVADNSSKFETVKKMNISNEKNTIHTMEENHYFYVDSTQYIEQIEFLGEKLLITEPTNWIKWKLSNETKDILGYKCYKAIFIKEGGNGINIEAWFAPEIPYQFGPKGYHGLPGLILEIKQNEKLIFTAIKINWDAKVFVNKPSKGRKISQSDFDNIVENYVNEIKDYHKN